MGSRHRLRPMQADGYFLSFDPGLWPGGCALTAVLDSKDSGASDAFDLGRVVRLPQIETSNSRMKRREKAAITAS